MPFSLVLQPFLPPSDIALIERVNTDLKAVLLKLLLCEPGTCLVTLSVDDCMKAHRRNKALTNQIAFLALVIFGYVNDHYNVAVAANEISDLQLTGITFDSFCKEIVPA